jgi:hypothetical protein
MEKRATRRFALKLSVAVKEGDGAVSAETRDISSRGISIFLDSPTAVGSELQFTLTLPPEVTLTDSLQVNCSAHVVRVESPDEHGRIAVAAVIDRYEFLPE